MGIKKTRQSNTEDAKSIYTNLLNELFLIIKPYFKFNGQLDSTTFARLTAETSVLFARILDCSIAIEENSISKYFCADDILPKKVIIENNTSMKFWGFIYWLGTPSDYVINPSGKDPFYAELLLSEDNLIITQMKCGDYSKINIDKIWWYDVELDWILEF